MRVRTVVLLGALVGALVATEDAVAQKSFGVNAVAKYDWITGGAGEALSGGWGGEGTLFLQSGRMRFGAGGSYSAIKTDAALPDATWGKLGIYGMVGGVFPSGGRFRPHVDFRFGWTQLSPDETSGSSIESASGWGAGLILGVEIPLSPNVAIDFSGASEHFNISDVDVTAGDVDTFGSGWSWGLRLGLTIQS